MKESVMLACANFATQGVVAKPIKMYNLYNM